MNSKLLERKNEKHEIQMLSCGAGLKADENWMSAETTWIRDVTRVREIWRATSVQVAVCSLDIVVVSLNKARFTSSDPV